MQSNLSEDRNINSVLTFEESNCNSIASSACDQEQVIAENPSHKTDFFDDNVENAKRLFKAGLITQESLDSWIVFLKIYQDRTDEPHPRLKKSQILNRCQQIEAFGGNDWEEQICYWFDNLPLKVEEPTFNAFATPDNLKMLHFKTR